jgi:hypothetical protein
MSEEVIDDSPFNLPPSDESDPFVLPTCDSIYRCQRFRTSIFQGRRKYFVMPVESDQWTATCKGTSFELLKQSASGESAAILLFNKDSTDFSLRINDEEVMTFAFRKPAKAPSRVLTVRIPRGDGALELQSRAPHMAPSGRWVLDLGGRPSVPSRKNCRLEMADHAPVIYVRKVQKGELEIQTSEESITHPFLLALCVGSFLCRLRM